jgi:hypothetical protein
MKLLLVYVHILKEVSDQNKSCLESTVCTAPLSRIPQCKSTWKSLRNTQGWEDNNVGDNNVWSFISQTASRKTEKKKTVSDKKRGKETKNGEGKELNI